MKTANGTASRIANEIGRASFFILLYFSLLAYFFCLFSKAFSLSKFLSETLGDIFIDSVGAHSLLLHNTDSQHSELLFLISSSSFKLKLVF